jgi:hypothetical protein
MKGFSRISLYFSFFLRCLVLFVVSFNARVIFAIFFLPQQLHKPKIRKINKILIKLIVVQSSHENKWKQVIIIHNRHNNF